VSPKKITQLGVIVGTVSIVGMIGMALVGPAWSWLTGWPAIGLGLAVLLLIVSFLRGAYLTAQRRVELVDKLNDCYTGVPASSDEAMIREAKRR
jgi:hypothetical protein